MQVCVCVHVFLCVCVCVFVSCLFVCVSVSRFLYLFVFRGVCVANKNGKLKKQIPIGAILGGVRGPWEHHKNPSES